MHGTPPLTCLPDLPDLPGKKCQGNPCSRQRPRTDTGTWPPYQADDTAMAGLEQMHCPPQTQTPLLQPIYGYLVQTEQNH